MNKIKIECDKHDFETISLLLDDWVSIHDYKLECVEPPKWRAEECEQIYEQ